MKTGCFLRDPKFLCFVLTQTWKVQSRDENSLFHRIGNIVLSLSIEKKNLAVEKPKKQYLRTSKFSLRKIFSICEE